MLCGLHFSQNRKLTAGGWAFAELARTDPWGAFVGLDAPALSVARDRALSVWVTEEGSPQCDACLMRRSPRLRQLVLEIEDKRKIRLANTESGLAARVAAFVARNRGDVQITPGLRGWHLGQKTTTSGAGDSYRSEMKIENRWLGEDGLIYSGRGLPVKKDKLRRRRGSELTSDARGRSPALADLEWIDRLIPNAGGGY